MPKFDEDLEGALEVVLTSYKEEYTRIANVWKDLETKAAAVTTIAGIFLGFVLNYIKDVHDQMSAIQQTLSGATLAFLLATLSLAVASVKVRERVRAPESEAFYKAVTDLHRSHDQTVLSEYPARILHDQIRGWNAAVVSRVKENRTKAKMIQSAHLCLLASMFLAAALACSTLFS